MYHLLYVNYLLKRLLKNLYVTPQCSQHYYLQVTRHGSNLSVPQQMNGYRKYCMSIQWNISQPQQRMHFCHLQQHVWT